MPKIISASYRTDIPAFHGEWFAKRLDEGVVMQAPSPKTTPRNVSLAPEDVSAFIFWTKNIAPFEPVLARVHARGTPFVVQHTVTNYSTRLEPKSPNYVRAADSIRRVVDTFGKGCVVWRYDPIVILRENMGVAWHANNFESIAREMEGSVDECVVSFVHFYQHVRAGLLSSGTTARNPGATEKELLLKTLAEIAHAFGIRLTTCAQPGLEVEGVGHARCVDTERLSRVAGREIVEVKGRLREGCGCAASVDIGGYNTCPGGCAFCYATTGEGVRSVAKDDPWILGPAANTRQRSLPLYAEMKAAPPKESK